jgi:hypothetical protein
MSPLITPDRVHPALRSACLTLLTTLATLAAIEIVLRVADFRILREGSSERSLTYQYDAELGWAPIPNSSATVTTARTIHARHNSLGLRDIEFARDALPTMLFIGDSSRLWQTSSGCISRSSKRWIARCLRAREKRRTKPAFTVHFAGARAVLRGQPV